MDLSCEHVIIAIAYMIHVGATLYVTMVTCHHHF